MRDRREKIGILKDLKKHLQQYFGDEILQVILFGFQTKGTDQSGSDYDVLVIGKSRVNWEIKNKIIDLCYDIDLKYGIIIDLHILAESEINELRGRQPIYFNAIETGIRV